LSPWPPVCSVDVLLGLPSRLPFDQLLTHGPRQNAWHCWVDRACSIPRPLEEAIKDTGCDQGATHPPNYLLRCLGFHHYYFILFGGYFALSQFHSLNTSPQGHIAYLNTDEHVKTFSFPAGGIQVLRLQVQYSF
jgi:hypothetical protein